MPLCGPSCQSGSTPYPTHVDIQSLPIAGAFVMTPEIHGDQRGAFLEWFRADRFREATGHSFRLQQANCSLSSTGTLRGIHFADVPPGQAKYITCPAGAILDVIVDLRIGSSTFSESASVVLDGSNRKAVYLGEGLGHGFMALADQTVVQYLCSTEYAPAREHGVNPLDPALGIDWPREDIDGRTVEHVLSAKDRAAPSLAEAEAAGQLPSYDAVNEYLASLGAES